MKKVRILPFDFPLGFPANVAPVGGDPFLKAPLSVVCDLLLKGVFAILEVVDVLMLVDVLVKAGDDDMGGVGGRPVDGLMGGLVKGARAFSRGLRNI